MSLGGELSAGQIQRATGFRLAVSIVDGLAPGGSAGLAGYHDEHERLSREFGWQNVIGSVYVEEGQFMLGIFMRHERIIDANLVSAGLPVAPPAASEIDEAPLSLE